MNIDMAVLRTLEHEKDLPLDVVVTAIEQALLVAYHRTPGARSNARVELDRRSGRVIVWARDRVESEEGFALTEEFEDTPDDFGRIAATTAKQIILQRLRDAEDEQRFGEFSAREGDIVSGVIQQGREPGDVLVDLGRVEALLPMAERVPGEPYEHGERIKALVTSVRRGPRGPQVQVSRTHP
ncbi:NusA N-terminal domain-containing protein, partial [Mumia zhuanghuii]